MCIVYICTDLCMHVHMHVLTRLACACVCVCVCACVYVCVGCAHVYMNVRMDVFLCSHNTPSYQYCEAPWASK